MKYLVAAVAFLDAVAVLAMAAKILRSMVRAGYRLSARDVPVLIALVAVIVLLLLLASWAIVAF